jgi:dihydrofolate reductase
MILSSKINSLRKQMLNGKRISMIAAMARNRVIGAANDIPWRVPGEQRRFRQLTEGNLVVMGRRTFDSIGRPLPDRDVLVIGSRTVPIEGMLTCRSIQESIEIISNDLRNEVFIAGGEQIYRQFLQYADTIYLTEIDLEPVGDTTFPDLPADFACVQKSHVAGPTAYTLMTYNRVID